jgi:hypothetical protein
MYVAEEHSIYGSSRVGVDNRKDTLYMSAAYTPTWGGVGTSRRDLGSKSFELANHLGNVLVTVSDKPVYKVSSATIFFQPEIISSSDYYPFGAPIHGRSYSSMEYRFGYNTQEKIDEIAGPGNHNTATFWEYDGRLVLRWNQDPKFIIGVSPYAINGDNPIFYTDPKGDFKKKFSAQLYKFLHGGKVEKDANNEYYVNKSFSDQNDVVNIRPRAYDFMGNPKRTRGERGDNSTSTFWNNINTGIGVVDIGQGVKGELISYAAKSSPTINDLKYVRGMEMLGGATFVSTSLISGGLAINYYRNGGTDNSVWMKSALDIGMGYVGFLGPIGFGVSATYFLLDASGTFQGWGDPLTKPKR